MTMTPVEIVQALLTDRKNLEAAADRGGDGSPSRDGWRLLAVGRDRITQAGRLGTRFSGKTGHRSDHRLLGSKPALNSKPAIEVTTGFLLAKTPSEPTDKRSGSGSEAYRELIELELSRGRNATGIFQDLVDTHGFTGGYQSVKRFVRKLRGTVSPEARVIIETKLGEEAQVDYGTGPMVAIRIPASIGARGCSC